MPVTAPPPVRNDSMRGIAFMAAGMFLFSAVDTQAKFLTQTLHPIQVVWSRQLGLVLGVFLILGFRGWSVLRTAHPRLQVARGAAAAGSAALFIIAIRYVPLADAVAVSFIAPFIVTVLGALILREPVGLRRWSAVTIGFLATLVVIRPGTGALHPAVFLVVVAAALFAIRQIISRLISGSDSTVTTVAYTALISVAILSVPMPFVWQMPATSFEITLLFTMAIMAAAAETLVIRALEVAQAVIVAPLQYTLILWSTMYGYLVFADLPDFWTWIGALIIVATGIYTLNRERIVVRQRKIAAKPGP